MEGDLVRQSRSVTSHGADLHRDPTGPMPGAARSPCPTPGRPSRGAPPTGATSWPPCTISERTFCGGAAPVTSSPPPSSAIARTKTSQQEDGAHSTWSDHPSASQPAAAHRRTLLAYTGRIYADKQMGIWRMGRRACFKRFTKIVAKAFTVCDRNVCRRIELSDRSR